MIFSFDGHYKGGKIYWISDTTGTSFRSSVLGSSVSDIVKFKTHSCQEESGEEAYYEDILWVQRSPQQSSNSQATDGKAFSFVKKAGVKVVLHWEETTGTSTGL